MSKLIALFVIQAALNEKVDHSEHSEWLDLRHERDALIVELNFLPEMEKQRNTISIEA